MKTDRNEPFFSFVQFVQMGDGIMKRTDRPDRSVQKLVEARLECIHYVGDLRLKYLKLIYNGGSISEHYRTGDACVHLHGLCHESATRRRKVTSVCYRLQVKSSTSGRLQVDESSVFVFLGKTLEFSQPLSSVVRLRFLDQCNVCDIQTFKVGLNPAPEILWRLTDRKLRSALL
jgi:hypothetical protein